VLNLNVPNLALGEIRGVRRARLATTGLILAAGTKMEHRGFDWTSVAEPTSAPDSRMRATNLTKL